MPDKKLTDKEIIKALECCKNDGIICWECPYKKANGCMEKLSADALDLINRLQEENNRLKEFSTSKCKDCAGCTSWKCDCANIEAEAYKEFAEKLHEELRIYGAKDKFNKLVFLNVVDNAKKELVGDGGCDICQSLACDGCELYEEAVGEDNV